MSPKPNWEDKIKSSAPEGAVFLGYGGSSVAYETLVFSYQGIEVRFPRLPMMFSPDEVENLYGCFSGEDWKDVLERREDLEEEEYAAN